MGNYLHPQNLTSSAVCLFLVVKDVPLVQSSEKSGSALALSKELSLGSDVKVV